LATRGHYAPPSTLPAGLKFLTPGVIAQAFDFPRDMGPIAVRVNTLNDQMLVRYYSDEFDKINR
jgi:spermidine synthase